MANRQFCRSVPDSRKRGRDYLRNPSARPVKRRGRSFKSRRALINSSRSRERGVKPSPAIGDLLAGRAVPSFMAVEKGSLQPLADATETEAAAGPVPVPTKRMRIDAAAKESAGGSNTGTEEVTHQTPAAAAAVGEGSSTSPAAFSTGRGLFASHHIGRQ